jgi:hypothetical protein
VTHTPFMKIGKNTRISYNGFIPLNLVCTPTYCFHLQILIVWSHLQEWNTVLSHYLTTGKELTTDTLIILVCIRSLCILGLQGLTVLSCITGLCVFFLLITFNILHYTCFRVEYSQYGYIWLQLTYNFF